MPRDDRWAPGCRSLGGDHPEGLGEHRGHDARVREGEQVPQVPVLERPREEHPDVERPRQRLERRPLGAEPHDHGPRVQPVDGLEQDVDALLLDQLAEVDDGRRVAVEERREPAGIPFVRPALLAIPGVRRVPPCLVDQGGERGVAALGTPQVDVDPGRHLVDTGNRTADLSEHLPDVGGADEGRARVPQRLPPPLTEIGTAPHRILELGAVRLHGERLPRGDADGTAEQHVVREDEIGGRESTHRRGVRFDPPVQLLPGAVRYPPHLVSGVAVDHEDGQKRPDIRPHRRRTSEVVVASGRASWLSTVTSCPARLHSRASWRV